jgi:hypothetical protein
MTKWGCRILVALFTVAHFVVSRAGAAEKEGGEEIDTLFIFGFTAGADVGELGEKEIEHEMIGRFGKLSGTYVIGLPFAYYDIAGVPDLDDIHRALSRPVRPTAGGVRPG